MSYLRCAGIILTGAALLLSISCEKHHLGEYPELQREQVVLDEPVKPESEPALGESPAATPVNFFPEKKSPSP